LKFNLGAKRFQIRKNLQPGAVFAFDLKSRERHSRLFSFHYAGEADLCYISDRTAKNFSATGADVCKYY